MLTNDISNSADLNTVIRNKGFYDFSTIIWPNNNLVRFYGISTIVGYLIPNPLYTYISNILDFIRLGFMAYQPL